MRNTTTIMNLLFILMLLFSSGEELKVDLVTRDNCWYSQQMRDHLKNQKIQYDDFNVTQRGYDKRVDLDLPLATFPLVFVNDEYVGGYEEAKQLPELNSHNEEL